MSKHQIQYRIFIISWSSSLCRVGWTRHTAPVTDYTSHLLWGALLAVMIARHYNVCAPRRRGRSKNNTAAATDYEYNILFHSVVFLPVLRASNAFITKVAVWVFPILVDRSTWGCPNIIDWRERCKGSSRTSHLLRGFVLPYGILACSLLDLRPSESLLLVFAAESER